MSCIFLPNETVKLLDREQMKEIYEKIKKAEEMVKNIEQKYKSVDEEIKKMIIELIQQGSIFSC